MKVEDPLSTRGKLPFADHSLKKKKGAMLDEKKKKRSLRDFMYSQNLC